MIRINLLPPELRRPERTPPARLYTTYLGVALTVGAIALGAWIFMQIKVLESEIANLEAQKRAAEAAVAEYAKVKEERDRYQARKDAVDQIKAKRKFRWSKQLDTLADAVDQTPRLWLASIKFGDGSPSGVDARKTGGRTVEYYMEMRDAQTATNDKDLYFEVEKVLTQKFIDTAAFGKLVDPSSIKVEKQEKYIEAWSHKFTILLLGLSQAAKPAGPPGTVPGGS